MTDTPFVVLDVSDDADRAIEQWRAAGLVVYELNGARMGTRPALFAEFAQAVELPAYFGRNFDALADCLTDLAWAPSSQGWLVAISRPSAVLADEAPTRAADLMATLREVLVGSHDYWARGAGSSSRTFQVVLIGDSEDAAVVRSHWHID